MKSELHFYSEREKMYQLTKFITFGALGHSDRCGKLVRGRDPFQLNHIFDDMLLDLAAILSLSFCSLRIFLSLHTKTPVHKCFSDSFIYSFRCLFSNIY